jgi:single-strand DNA-binding protein
MNKVLLIGNLGKDPEIRNTQDGKKTASMTLATSESWTDRASGERKERTEWHRVVVFNEMLATIAEKWAKKGSKVMVEGTLQTRKWTGQDGVERYSTEVVLGPFKSSLLILDSSHRDDGQAGSADTGGSGRRGSSRASGAADPAQRDASAHWIPGAATTAPRADGKSRFDDNDEIPF